MWEKSRGVSKAPFISVKKKEWKLYTTLKPTQGRHSGAAETYSHCREGTELMLLSPCRQEKLKTVPFSHTIVSWHCQVYTNTFIPVSLRRETAGLWSRIKKKVKHIVWFLCLSSKISETWKLRWTFKCILCNCFRGAGFENRKYCSGYLFHWWKY